MPTITKIPEGKDTLEKVYYHGLYIILHFNMEDGVESNYDQRNIIEYPDEEEMEDVKLDDDM